MQGTDPLPARQSESETSDYVDHFDITARSRLVSQGVLHYSGQVATILSSLVLVPIMLLRLGAEAYGFWIVALAAPGFVAGLDNVFYHSITRETAANRSENRIQDQSTSEFLSACCGAYAVFGLLVAALLVIFGRIITQNLHLSSVVQQAVPVTFLAVAIAFATGRIVVFGNAVLAGFQRFGTSNCISVGALALRFFGFALLLEWGRSLSAIAIWYACVAVLECIFVLAFVKRLGALRGDRSLIRWKLLRRAGEFGFVSFLTTIFQNLFWFSPPILLGMLSGGTTSTMSLYVGQRPCFIVSELNWRGAEVLFSASATQDERRGEKAYSELMLFGTKFLLAIAVPLCIGLFILAPTLIHVWLGVAQPETAKVMRVTSIGVVADALWVGPLHVLWGHGRAMRVLLITVAVTVSILLLNFSLVPLSGAAGSALAFTVSAWLGAIITIIHVARTVHSSWFKFLISAFSEVALPSLVLAVFALTISAAMSSYPRVMIATAVLGGGILYVILYWRLNRIRIGSEVLSQHWLRGMFKGS